MVIGASGGGNGRGGRVKLNVNGILCWKPERVHVAENIVPWRRRRLACRDGSITVSLSRGEGGAGKLARCSGSAAGSWRCEICGIERGHLEGTRNGGATRTVRLFPAKYSSCAGSSPDVGGQASPDTRGNFRGRRTQVPRRPRLF